LADMCLKIAACQFAVSGSIIRNAGTICDFLKRARRKKADIVHFPECALSGYAGVDFQRMDEPDRGMFKEKTDEIKSLAGKLRLWVVLGSIHWQKGFTKPCNSLYLINPQGRIVKRYDKRFCMDQELQYYRAGERFVIFTINGVKCSLLICFDARFPELYRELYKRRVKCVFQSFYNARQKGRSVHTHIIRQTMQCRAATNHFWVSGVNSSGYYSPYPSFFIQPDGRIVSQLKANRPGLMINTVNLNKDFYDPMKNFRDTAMAGRLNNRPKISKNNI